MGLVAFVFDIVVTGVGGFIGRHVAQKLVELGHKVVGVDDFSSGTRDSLEFLESLICIDLSDAHDWMHCPAIVIISFIWPGNRRGN